MIIRSCKGCIREFQDESDICDECSVGDELECSCHINPPCSACEYNKYEERQELKEKEVFIRINLGQVEEIFTLLDAKKIPFKYEKNILNKYHEGVAISDLSFSEAGRLIKYLEAK